MIYDLEEGDYLGQAREELKRVDHLIFVSLKYTRTVDVLKSVLTRLINCFECIINGVLNDAYEQKKIKEVPPAIIKKCSALKELYPGKYDELVNFFIFLRKVSKAEYEKLSEYRRPVAFIAHTEDEGNIDVNIDVVTEYYRKAQKIMEEIIEKKL
ncbi:hypothetical protein HY636_04115 [Candidatus Woesearchaeota archaeon]|nr:hypothetical protein [Nitrosarchaeum sp.]MBI4453803.1 hypothetical protein [Candidatus Woesearchaeota archaeon]